MKHTCTVLAVLLVLVVLLCSSGFSQQMRWMVGGRAGLSIASGGGGSEAGFQIGPTGELIFNKVYAVVSSLNINTQTGTPIEWANEFKYYFSVPGSAIRPYADGGFSLWFVTGGPYFAIAFGGGALFPVGRNLYVPADLQLGPIFATGSAVFGLELTSGIRYEF